MLAKENCNKGGVGSYDLKYCKYYVNIGILHKMPFTLYQMGISKVAYSAAYHRMLQVDFLEVVKCTQHCKSIGPPDPPVKTTTFNFGPGRCNSFSRCLIWNWLKLDLMFFLFVGFINVLHFGLSFRTYFYADGGDSCWRSLIAGSCVEWLFWLVNFMSSARMAWFPGCQAASLAMTLWPRVLVVFELKRGQLTSLTLRSCRQTLTTPRENISWNPHDTSSSLLSITFNPPGRVFSATG